MSLPITAILLCLSVAKIEAGLEFGRPAKSRALTGLETLLHDPRSSSNAKGSDCSREVVNVARAFTSEMMTQMAKINAHKMEDGERISCKDKCLILDGACHTACIAASWGCGVFFPACAAACSALCIVTHDKCVGDCHHTYTQYVTF